MTREQASEVAAMFREIGGFSSINVGQVGGEFAAPTNPWNVELWCVNARAGNRNLEIVKTPVSAKEAKLIAKQAKGKANERDRAALNRMAAERAMDAE